MADGAHEVTINDEEVPVTGEPGIDVAKCISSSVFTDWVSSVDPAFLVERVHLLLDERAMQFAMTPPGSAGGVA